IAEDFEPSVTYSYSGYANFTEILSADSVQYIIDYDTLSILDANQKIITIPIDNIENLDNSIEFISGLHFEPSGTKFLQPVQVTVLMKDSIPEDFLVFHCNDQGEINFIPYISYGLTTSGYCIVFNINHFSSVGIGTGEIPTTDPAELTTTDQFVSYWAKCVANDVEITEEFFETWYTNVIVPMINNISTVDQLKGALSEFMQIHRKFDLMGPGGLFSEISFYDQAMGMFSAKMMNIWNELINLYDIKDNCLKRELLEIAAKLVRLGDLISGLCQLDLDDFGDGEFYNLATKIEFAKPIKYMKINESYIVEYTLKCISGNPLPEKITWSSSKSSVATINSEGKIVALSEGVTTIKGKFCDIENTFKVEVEGFNCEENYCNSIYQPDHPCFDGTYICTGALPKHDLWWPVGCTYSEVTDRITVLIDLTSGGYFKSTWTNEGAIYDLVEECIPYYNIIPNTMFHYEYYLKPWLSFGMNCEGVNKLSFHLGDMQGGYYNFTQVVYDDHLMFDLIRYLSTPTYSVYTTRLFCTLIDE
ncbi:MAG: Ig-like domain-containing protein, partial [Bacteroidales bacterium]|nr:Ig-like domain-containing protein [Bacteroidales bacterium]